MSEQQKGQPADLHLAESAGSGAGNPQGSAKMTPPLGGLQGADQSLRQAVSLCATVLPDDQQNAAGVEREVRRLMDGILADLHENPQAFGVAAPAAGAPTTTGQRLLALLRTPIGPRWAQSWAWPVFVACALYNLYGSSIGWSRPILDAHGFRQTQTAINVYYMLRGSPRLFYEDPVLGPPWASPIEFPIFQWIVAAIAATFGTPLDQTGRFVSLLFFWSALLVAYRLLRSLGLSSRIAWWSFRSCW